MDGIFCSQNCVFAGEEIADAKGFHGCNKQDLKIGSLEKRSGCKYCPGLERIHKRKGGKSNAVAER